MVEMRNAYKILIEKPERIDHLGNLGTKWRIIIKWVLNRRQGCGLD
jgi:hypothetical protein